MNYTKVKKVVIDITIFFVEVRKYENSLSDELPYTFVDTSNDSDFIKPFYDFDIIPLFFILRIYKDSIRQCDP